jgi:hypothetical protein
VKVGKIKFQKKRKMNQTECKRIKSNLLVMHSPQVCEWICYGERPFAQFPCTGSEELHTKDRSWTHQAKVGCMKTNWRSFNKKKRNLHAGNQVFTSILPSLLHHLGALLILPPYDFHATPVGYCFFEWHVVKRVVLLSKHCCTERQMFCKLIPELIF